MTILSTHSRGASKARAPGTHKLNSAGNPDRVVFMGPGLAASPPSGDEWVGDESDFMHDALMRGLSARAQLELRDQTIVAPLRLPGA
jgi:hypothetical protein